MVLVFVTLNAAPSRLEKIIFNAASGKILCTFPGLKQTCLACRGTCSGVHNDETLLQHDETSCTIMSMNTRIGGFPDDVAKWYLLIYNLASLPSEDEDGRIAMLDRLSSIEPTTHLYRHHLRWGLERLDTGASDWLLLSSEFLSGLPSECMWSASAAAT